jgi:hypothetical protein
MIGTNGIQQLLVYADDVSTLRDNINTLKNIEALFEANRKVGLEVNAQKTKYVVMSRHQNAGLIII